MENKNKNLFETMVETHNKTMNNWIETTQKMQKAALGGQSIEKGTELYKEWINNQMNILTNATNEIKNKTHEATENVTKTWNTEDFYKNWYQNQLSFIKQMMDANQNFYNALINFGKPTSEVNESYTQMNNTLTTLYNNWNNTLNAMFNNLYQGLNGNHQNTLKSMFDGLAMYTKMQEIFTPWIKTATTGTWNAETFKTLLEPSKVKEITEKMFEAFFHYPNMKEMVDAYVKNYETFFHNFSNNSKDFFENFRNTWSHMPSLISGDVAKITGIYNQFSNLMHTTYGPVVRLIAQSPEKRNLELVIETNDKFMCFVLKQAQLQYLLYTTTQLSLEKTAEFFAEKMKNGTEIKSVQQLFTEWVAVAEKVFLDLFNSEEYSKLKGEVLAEGMAFKKLVEKQFENWLENTPFIFRSEMDDLYKTIHDLKKKVRDLETRLAVNSAANTELEEEKTTRTTKRK